MRFPFADLFVLLRAEYRLPVKHRGRGIDAAPAFFQPAVKHAARTVERLYRRKRHFRFQLLRHFTRGAACAKYTRSHPAEALAALWRTDGHAAAARLEVFLKQLPRAKKLALIAGETDIETLFGERLGDFSYERVR